MGSTEVECLGSFYFKLGELIKKNYIWRA